MLGFIKNWLDDNAREIKKLQRTVDEINKLEREMSALPEDGLKGMTAAFRERLDRGQTLDDILPEAFAVVREASRRVLGMRHFDVQLMGGIVLHQGRIAEMRTGEGKTLVATLPVYLNALTGRGVHVVTVNDYLARRDSEWMGQIYTYLGLSVGLVVHGLDWAERRQAYSADITYGTNNEFGFDYLRDNMAHRPDQLVQRELNYAIVDVITENNLESQDGDKKQQEAGQTGKLVDHGYQQAQGYCIKIGQSVPLEGIKPGQPGQMAPFGEQVKINQQMIDNYIGNGKDTQGNRIAGTDQPRLPSAGPKGMGRRQYCQNILGRVE
jgi:hypothetical protein